MIGNVNWEAYIGIPFAHRDDDSRNGTNCWGLVRLIYREVRGILLPSFEGQYSGIADYETIDRLIGAEIRKNWLEIPIPRSLSAIVIRYGRANSHIGIVIDNRRFLHTSEDGSSRWEDFTSFRWRKRVVGFYQYNV